MTLNANLVLERRSLWEVLFNPFRSLVRSMSAASNGRGRGGCGRSSSPRAPNAASPASPWSPPGTATRSTCPGLRQRYATSSKGATLAELMAVASDLELAPRALRLEVDEIGKLQTPAVLHWDLNHFVVLEKADGKGATILDPAARPPDDRRSTELGRHFTGVALELTPTTRFMPVEARTRTRLSDLWSKLVGYRSATFQILALSLLLQLTTLAMPFFLQLTVDEAIGQGDTNLLLLLLVGFAVVHLFYAVIRGLRSWVVLTLGQSLSLQLGGNVFRHLLRLPLAYFERRHVGDLMSRIGSIQPIQSILSQGLVNVVIDSGLALTTLVVMAMISIPLTLFVVVDDRASISPTASSSSPAFAAARRRRSSPARARKPI